MPPKTPQKSLFRRLTRLFRSGPLVKRKIRTSDTAMAVPDKTKSSGVLLFQKSTSPTYATITGNAYNLSERLMRYQDFNEMEYSVSFQTLIPTQDGFKTIGELAQECKNDPEKTFIVYAFDHVKQKIVPALGKQARQTCVDQAWKVTFDNGKSLTASPEHRLMLRDGSYRRVEDLKPGDAMMPFHRKDLFENAQTGTNGYQWIYTMDPEHKGWTKEHHLIAEWVAGRKLTDDECVHHINFVKHDNRPENLRIMTKSNHNAYHQSLNNDVKWAPENTQWIEEFKKNHAAWMRDHAPTRRYDVTFSKILETCERIGFRISAIRDSLDVSEQLINERLVSHGFASFEQFVQAYRAGQIDADIKPNKPGLLTRDLTLNLISQTTKINDTKRSLCIKLGCTVNVLDKFLARRAKISWSELRQSLGFIDSVETTGSNRDIRAGGRPKGSNSNNLSFKQICDAFEPAQCMTLPQLAHKLNVNKNTVISRLAQNGFKKYGDFAETYQNCKVVSVEYVGIMPLYDLTVDGYKNFATDSVISHNTPEIARGMDIYADESVASDDKGRVLHIHSSNQKIKELLEDLFYNTLNVEFNLRSWTRSLVKYGDFFLYNDVSPEYGVVNAFPIPVNEIEREENYDRDDPFAVRFRWVSLANRILENWEVTHFRLLGNDLFLPYGSSVIEPARRIWRQLILIEDAMLVYRVVRAPERRVFYIDVGNTPAEDVPGYVEEQKKQLRSQQVVDRATGRVDLRYNPLSVDEDYFIAVRGAETGTRIETLKGGENAAAVEDVAYIQKKLFAALGIPRAYLGYDELLSSKATLAQEDIRFSRSIAVIQKTITAELNKLAIIHLYSHGFEGEELQDFILRLSNPSTVAQQQKLELIRARAEIAGSFPDGIVDKQWIRKEVLSFTDEHIDEIDRLRMKERMIDAQIDAIAEAPEGGGGGGRGAGGGLFGGSAGGETGGGEEFGEPSGTEGEPAAEEPEAATGGEEELTAADEPNELDEPEVSLLTSGEDIDDSFGLPSLSEKEKTSPVRVSSTLDKVLYNRGRRRTHGASKTHMPDFKKMTGNNTQSMKDPFDNDWIKATVSNPLGEAPQRVGPLPGYMRSMLKRMSDKLGTDSVQHRSGVLTEDVEVDVWDGVSEDQRPTDNAELYIDESSSDIDDPEEQ